LLAALALAAVGGAAAVLGSRWALAPLAATAPEVLFVVEPGASLSRVASHLESRGLIRSALAVRWLARSRDLSGQLQVGEYFLSAAQTPEEILLQIVAGRVATYPVVLPEGLTAREIAERLQDAGLADAAEFESLAYAPEIPALLGVEGGSLEGYLFPSTYRLPHGLSAREVAKVLVAQFQRVWAEIEPTATGQGLSMRDVVTLASIIEKETAVPAERPLIASVFRNRIERGMRLETDPTVIYGIPDFDGNLQRRHLEDPANPYNTYIIEGLPPGPIANPGAESLRAVVEPAESDYLFFVSRNDGTHTFSKTYGEHVLAVNRYQRRGKR
jgi:UPF0755 protein